MLLAAAISLGARGSWAQLAPDPRMLLDLDLFASNSNGPPDARQNSMLDQIQTLRAMGYLNAAPPPPPQSVLTIPPPPSGFTNPPPPVNNAPPPPDSEDQVTE
jgi:hypothetical protein